MISYAQNGEDVVLARALGDAPGGCYIDIGAGSPTYDSVTRHFYDHGWRGINVEPLESQLSLLIAERAEDVNLGVAVGAAAGRVVLYHFGEMWGWSSVSADVAQHYRSQGHAVAERSVEMTTLAAICSEHVHGAIDFLKIDVEGHERDVLRGADFARWRPRIVVVEATVPNSPEPNHHAWEPLLLDAEYVFAYFDGVNRFYVSAQSRDLIPRLAIPPNVFDDAVPFRLHELRTAHVALELYARNLELELRAHSARFTELLAYIDHLESEIRAKDGHIEQVGLYVERLLAEIKSHEQAVTGGP